MVCKQKICGRLVKISFQVSIETCYGKDFAKKVVQKISQFQRKILRLWERNFRQGNRNCFQDVRKNIFRQLVEKIFRILQLFSEFERKIFNFERKILGRVAETEFYMSRATFWFFLKKREHVHSDYANYQRRKVWGNDFVLVISEAAPLLFSHQQWARKGPKSNLLRLSRNALVH